MGQAQAPANLRGAAAGSNRLPVASVHGTTHRSDGGPRHPLLAALAALAAAAAAQRGHRLRGLGGGQRLRTVGCGGGIAHAGGSITIGASSYTLAPGLRSLAAIPAEPARGAPWQ